MLIESIIAPSPIHGKGLFAQQAVKIGDYVCRPPYFPQEYKASDFINHSDCPNIVRLEDCWIALDDIAIGDEITFNYLLEKDNLLMLADLWETKSSQLRKFIQTLDQTN